MTATVYDPATHLPLVRLAHQLGHPEVDLAAVAAATLGWDPEAVWPALCDHYEHQPGAAWLCELVLESHHAPTDILDRALDWALDHTETVNLGAIAANPNATSGHIDRVDDAVGELMPAAICAHPAVTDETFTRRVANTHIVERRRLIGIEHLSAAAVDLLARDDHAMIRRDAAARLDCPSSTLATLTRDDNWEVARTAMHNPSCPTTAIDDATHSKDDTVALTAYRELRARGALHIDT